MKQNWKNAAYCFSGFIQKQNETHDDFSRSWLRRISPLIWRIPIFIWAVILMTWSIIFFWGPREKFFLYMTHWGLLLITLETFFGIIVTIMRSNNETEKNDATFGLPWYVKTYWVLYNITIPVAFLVTVFYWGILRNLTEKNMNYAPNPIVDVMLHGVNSALMFLELISSAHPSRLLHIMQPLYFALVYLLFTVAYYFAGGSDPWGNPFIYPVIDWSKPEKTIVVTALTGLFLGLMHLFVVGVAALRDLAARKFLNTSPGVYNDGFA